jgi:hypothetical protein
MAHQSRPPTYRWEMLRCPQLVQENSSLKVRRLLSALLTVTCKTPGVFVQEWPAIFGCDVAGEVYEVGKDVERFKRGYRVIGYII